ncbi:MAG: hypothetical protein J6K29_09170 [Clostridia bacterium]|nr:hypothetical protein [Clostridia bacterium]
MKKQTITKQDIQRDLLALLNKRKSVTVWLTFFLSISILFYIMYAVLYAKEVYLPPRHLTFVSPTAVMVIAPVIILFILGFLLCYYYLKFFEIKIGRFSVSKEKLYQKGQELKSYYRRMERENALYFRSGRIAVNDKVYSYSKVDDSFYLVKLKSSKAPFFAYHTNFYEINDIL